MSVIEKAGKWIALATFLVALVLFAIYVWPTRYAYYKADPYLEYGDPAEMLIRVDRLTGEAEYYASGKGWKR